MYKSAQEIAYEALEKIALNREDAYWAGKGVDREGMEMLRKERRRVITQANQLYNTDGGQKASQRLADEMKKVLDEHPYRAYSPQPMTAWEIERAKVPAPPAGEGAMEFLRNAETRARTPRPGLAKLRRLLALAK